MAIDLSPRFTVSLRGYDKEEVERYLATVSERSSQTDDQLYELQEQNRYLEEEHERLAARVEELEGAIRSETPHTVGALGQRITLILNEAEEGAAETLAQAKADADRLLAVARGEADTLRGQAGNSAKEASDTLVAARRQGDELTQRLEMEAKARASSILNDAEHRAQRRQDQIEKWAQEMIAHTQAEQARLSDEFAMIRRGHEAEVRALTGDRDDAITALRALQASLAQAVERVEASRPRTPGAGSQPSMEATTSASVMPARSGGATDAAFVEDAPPEAAPEPEDVVAERPVSTGLTAGARFLYEEEDEDDGSTGPTAILGIIDPTGNGNAGGTALD
jgi:DivIVA domain-containing protein